MSSYFETVKSFFRWWVGELTQLLPARFRESWNPQRPALLVSIEGGQLTLKKRGGDREIAVGSVDLGQDDPAKLWSDVKAIRKAVRVWRRDATIRIPQDSVLRPTMELPAAARENLREIVSFEMDRFTPFRSDEVYFDYRISAEDKDRKRLGLEVAVVHKDGIDPYIGALHGLGLDLRGVEIEGDDKAGRTPFNLLPPKAPGSNDRLKDGIRASALIAIAMIAATVVYWPLAERKEELATSNAAVAEARQKKLALNQLQEQIDKLVERSAIVIDMKSSQPAFIEILNEITRILPNDTWLTRVAWKGERLTLTGYSERASNLIGLMEDSDFLAEVAFAAPVTVDPRVQRERFKIIATMDKG